MADEIDKLLERGLVILKGSLAPILIAEIMHHVEDVQDALLAGKVECARDLRKEAFELASELLARCSDREINESFSRENALEDFVSSLDYLMQKDF
jgi:hypothetical protein